MARRDRATLHGLAAALVLLGGCTMCPDPYDYSGPVPNGSAPQNDFRARSNGIIPIGIAPRPWPTIVKRPRPSAAERSVVASAATEIPAVIPEGPLDVATALERIPADRSDNQADRAR